MEPDVNFSTENDQMFLRGRLYLRWILLQRLDVSDGRLIDILDLQYDSVDVDPRESVDIDTET